MHLKGELISEKSSGCDVRELAAIMLANHTSTKEIHRRILSASVGERTASQCPGSSVRVLWITGWLLSPDMPRFSRPTRQDGGQVVSRVGEALWLPWALWTRLTGLWLILPLGARRRDVPHHRRGL